MPVEVFFFLKFSFDNRLRGDACVIGPRHPQRVESLHAFEADDNILQGVIERVPQVERTGDIRRRNDDGEGAFGIFLPLRIGIAIEILVRFPKLVPLFLRSGVIVLFGQFFGGRGRSRHGISSS